MSGTGVQRTIEPAAPKELILWHDRRNRNLIQPQRWTNPEPLCGRQLK